MKKKGKKKERKIDCAWTALDKRYEVVFEATHKPHCFISAEQIHGASSDYPEIKFEPRLLTHFDTREQMPTLFTENNLSVLPKDDGYVIGQFDPFVKLSKNPDKIEVKRVPPRTDLEPLNYIPNEAMGINYAEAYGFIEDFIGDGTLTPTVSGRHGGGDWEYKIPLKKGGLLSLNSGRPQIEVDGGYESKHSLILIEAKSRLVGEFCLRQLYFPFRAWRERVTKPVRTIFLAISGNDYFFYEFSFPDPLIFDGRLIRATHYIVDADAISRNELHALWRSAQPEEDLEIPFPQANSIETVLDVILQIAASDKSGTTISNSDLAKIYGFAGRQGSYYGNTAAYFGFAKRSHVDGKKKTTNYYYSLTEKGDRYVAQSARGRRMSFFRALMNRPVFYHGYKEQLETGVIPSKNKVMRLITIYRPELGPGTVSRRADTIISWFRWIDRLTI